jgi:hypothetical protein
MRIAPLLASAALAFLVSSTSQAQEADLLAPHQAEATNHMTFDLPDPVQQGGASSELNGLVVGGAVLLGVGYLAGLAGVALDSVVACGGDGPCPSGEPRPSYAPMGLPVVGPFIELAEPGLTPGAKGVAVLDGLLQAGGFAMVMVGIAQPKKTALPRGRDARSGGVSVSMTPIVAPGLQGVGLVGRF